MEKSDMLVLAFYGNDGIQFGAKPGGIIQFERTRQMDIGWSRAYVQHTFHHQVFIVG
jgi:hypothetical protein